jgi:predicted RNA-binding protein YlxR (DUF448 family)
MGVGEEKGDRGPLRLCAVSRIQRTPDELIRFVPGPDGTLVPDLARRLPGRGVWVTATRQALEAAVKKNAFQRSLRSQVRVPADLPAVVEHLMAKRLADAVSLANKAGLLVAGFTKVEELIGRGSAAVLLHASDAAADGVARLDRKFRALWGPEKAEQATVRELSSEELSLAIGRANVIHAAASEGGASRRMQHEALRLKRYRSGLPDRTGTSPDAELNTGNA